MHVAVTHFTVHMIKKGNRVVISKSLSTRHNAAQKRSKHIPADFSDPAEPYRQSNDIADSKKTENIESEISFFWHSFGLRHYFYKQSEKEYNDAN